MRVPTPRYCPIYPRTVSCSRKLFPGNIFSRKNVSPETFSPETSCAVTKERPGSLSKAPALPLSRRSCFLALPHVAGRQLKATKAFYRKISPRKHFPQLSPRRVFGCLGLRTPTRFNSALTRKCIIAPEDQLQLTNPLFE